MCLVLRWQHGDVWQIFHSLVPVAQAHLVRTLSALRLVTRAHRLLPTWRRVTAAADTLFSLAVLLTWRLISRRNSDSPTPSECD